MTSLDVVLAGERLELPILAAAPVARGTLEAWLSSTRAGAPAHPTLVRVLRVEQGQPEPFALFVRDVRAAFPAGRRAHLVVAYGGTVLSSTEVRVSHG